MQGFFIKRKNRRFKGAGCLIFLLSICLFHMSHFPFIGSFQNARSTAGLAFARTCGMNFYLIKTFIF